MLFASESWNSFEIDCYKGDFPFHDGSIVSGGVEKKCELSSGKF